MNKWPFWNKSVRQLTIFHRSDSLYMMDPLSYKAGKNIRTLSEKWQQSSYTQHTLNVLLFNVIDMMLLSVKLQMDFLKPFSWDIYLLYKTLCYNKRKIIQRHRREVSDVIKSFLIYFFIFNRCIDMNLSFI